MAKKDTANEPAAAPETVTVRVTGQPVAEGGHYSKGEIFATTPDRAAALVGLVEVVDAADPSAEMAAAEE